MCDSKSVEQQANNFAVHVNAIVCGFIGFNLRQERSLCRRKTSIYLFSPQNAGAFAPNNPHPR
jgi:hypothetical protein